MLVHESFHLYIKILESSFGSTFFVTLEKERNKFIYYFSAVIKKKLYYNIIRIKRRKRVISV
jgi:hypothetical protein